MDAKAQSTRKDYTASEIAAIAHLYRGEIYRSTIWRQRLDTTTNWSVVTLGIALSVSFASPDASPLPLILVGVLVLFFLMLEARRYRYFNVWRARARWLETHFYAPMLTDGDLHLDAGWQDTLAKDYMTPKYHISMLRAIGRRLRRSYIWILFIQTAAFYGKILVHPTGIVSFDQLWPRAAIGLIPGELVLTCGVLYNLSWAGLALFTYLLDRNTHKSGPSGAAMG